MPTSNQLLKNATYKVAEVFQSAISEAVNSQCATLMPELILYALTEQSDSIVLQTAQSLSIDEVTAKNTITNAVFESINNRSRQSAQPSQNSGLHASQELIWLIERADAERQQLGDAYISTMALFLAFFDSRQTNCKLILKISGFSAYETRKSVIEIHKRHRIIKRDDESRQSVLSEYTRDLTAMAKRGELDPVAERDAEIQRLIQTLSRRKKNNPVLVGEPGVGKTVIVEGLVQKIVSGDVPQYLRGKRVLSLEIGDIVAGAKLHGEFEERVKLIKDEVISLQGEVILFIDEIHTIAGASHGSGGLDASHLLKSALAKGQLQCIGATTHKEYKTHIAIDPALERRLQPIAVLEPSLEQAQEMLQILKPKYELHHSIHLTDTCIKAAVELSHRYIVGRSLPDKAIDLIDEAAAQKRMKVAKTPPEIQELESEKKRKMEQRDQEFNRQNFAKVAEIQIEIINLETSIVSAKNRWELSISLSDKEVSASDIAETVSHLTGIPVSRLQEGDYKKLLDIENNLRKRVLGQETALATVANAIRRNRVGLRKRKAPIASFLFLGPTGVGKTELAKALAELLLDTENRLIRFDMSEFMERHEVSKLIGSPPGYVGYGEGGQLTEAIRKNPYSVLLFDEVEKAHPDVFNIFLQLLDDARLTNAEGQTINFENTIVIFTSNIGSEHINSLKRAMGLGQTQAGLTQTEVRDLVLDEAKNTFRPEFLNRLDDTIVFQKLNRTEIEKILDLNIAELRLRLQKINLTLSLSNPARNLLLDLGFDPIFGARPLRRVMERELENKIALEIVRGGKQERGNVLVDVCDTASNTLEIRIEFENMDTVNSLNTLPNSPRDNSLFMNTKNTP